jgi:hypothetical protein
MDNAAFEPSNGNESARILRALADWMRDKDLQPVDELKLHDVNGQTCGSFRVWP